MQFECGKNESNKGVTRCVSMAPIYHLYTTGWKGDEVFIGSFSSIEKARFHGIERMLLYRRTWVELDEIDNPVGEQNIVWETNSSVN